MKKIITSIASLMLFSSIINAEDLSAYCSDAEVDNMVGHYVYVGSTTSSHVAYDEKTVIVDRKNKTITVWEGFVSTPAGHDYNVQTYGASVRDVGVLKLLTVFDIDRKMTRLKTSAYYSCSGRVVHSFSGAGWRHIVEGSIDEDLFKELKRRYNM